MKRKRLVIFDYSGTLSMEAVLFSRPERLTSELKECGLADLGIAIPEVFWTKVVNPTWQEGSTTKIGYERIMKRVIVKGVNPNVSDEAMNRAVSTFVARYFENSAIDPLWGPVLQRLAGDESICGVVATDHYAEATGYILGHLGTLGIQAHSVESTDTHLSRYIYVANSADLGAHKANALFWEKLKSNLLLESVTEIMIVDDFGFNETAGDDYAALEKADTRKALTEAVLKDTFSVPVYMVPFMIEEPAGGLESYDRERDTIDKILQVSDMMTDRFWSST